MTHAQLPPIPRVQLPGHENAKGFPANSFVLAGKDGMPLLVFRGEHGIADSHEEQLQTRGGSYTFSTLEAASLYAIAPNNNTDKAHQPRIYPAYLSINNPFSTDGDDPFLDLSLIEEHLGYEDASRIAIKFSQHIYNTGNWMEEINADDEYDSVEAFLTAHPGRLHDLYFDAYPFYDDPEVIALLVSKGFDGAIHCGNGETSGVEEYRVFSADQVTFALAHGAGPALSLGAETAKSLSEVLRSAKRNTSFGLQPDPIAEQLFGNVGIANDLRLLETKLWDLGIDVVGVHGAGASSIVLDAGEFVVRLGGGECIPRPFIAEFLQAPAYGKTGSVRWEVLPKVETASITQADVDQMTNALTEKGCKLVDAGVDNLGRLPSGNLVVIDPGAVGMSSALRPDSEQAIAEYQSGLPQLAASAGWKVAPKSMSVEVMRTAISQCLNALNEQVTHKQHLNPVHVPKLMRR